ncbi:NERD domain-containing protein [Anaeromyxobacter sp. SG17]|uniref:NERD domain-containing protein n=1 Tax=Anaeromyxobacter sp. SG17 TaxID=2925405 RepID=UPI0027E05BB9|nr:NERD domain-containing protein [Anaeromyxobacter sp. SG17]
MPPPRLNPAEAPRPAKSEAERTVWKALKNGLPSGWTAWHSLRIRDGRNYLGEGDFVLAHPQRGFLILEVKGGRIEQRDGRWFTNGIPFDTTPLDQAHGFMHKLEQRLKDWKCYPPAFGAALALPDTDFDEQPQEDVLRGVVLGRMQLRWLGEALPGVVERALPPPQPGTSGWMDRLHQMWGETWVPALSLGTRLRSLGERQFALDDVQLAALDGLLDNDRVLVRGGAGSGKTLLAVEAARRHAGEGKRVLLLCFTQPLRKWLEVRLAGSGVEVQTVSGLAKSIADAADGPNRQGDLTANEYWQATYERAADLCEARWDAVVVDEGQDLTFEAWYLVRGLAEGARLWAFHDPGQGFWPDRAPVPDLFATTFRLTRGQRCPAGIGALAALYAEESGDEKAIAAAVRDRTIALVECADAAKTADRVGEEIDRLLSQGLTLADIGVVSLRGQTAPDAIHQRGRIGRHAFVHADDPDMESRLVADTFLRWKGLERPAIVVADVDPGLKQFGTRMHIALTRALVAARIVAPHPGEGRWPGMASGANS